MAAKTRLREDKVKEVVVMEATNMNPYRRNPYDVQEEKQNVGMSAIEMVLWLLIMAALSIAMIWLLWSSSR